MLVIRLNRTGRKNRASFRIVVQEKTITPGGRHVEMVGSLDPCKKKVSFKNDRILYWLSQGAQPSDTVYNLLVSQGVVEGKKRAIKMKRPVKETSTSTDQQEIVENGAVEEKSQEVLAGNEESDEKGEKNEG